MLLNFDNGSTITTDLPDSKREAKEGLSPIRNEIGWHSTSMMDSAGEDTSATRGFGLFDITNFLILSSYVVCMRTSIQSGGSVEGLF